MIRLTCKCKVYIESRDLYAISHVDYAINHEVLWYEARGIPKILLQQPECDFTLFLPSALMGFLLHVVHATE